MDFVTMGGIGWPPYGTCSAMHRHHEVDHARGRSPKSGDVCRPIDGQHEVATRGQFPLVYYSSITNGTCKDLAALFLACSPRRSYRAVVVTLAW